MKFVRIVELAPKSATTGCGSGRYCTCSIKQQRTVLPCMCGYQLPLFVGIRPHTTRLCHTSDNRAAATAKMVPPIRTSKRDYFVHLSLSIFPHPFPCLSVSTALSILVIQLRKQVCAVLLSTCLICLFLGLFTNHKLQLAVAAYSV